MYRSGNVFFKDRFAGLVWQDEKGYAFEYDKEYLSNEKQLPIDVSLTLPLRTEPYRTDILHPFFDGLIPEGWLLDIVVQNWKVNPRDRMGLLLIACKDCIGAVTIISNEKNEQL